MSDWAETNWTGAAGGRSPMISPITITIIRAIFIASLFGPIFTISSALAQTNSTVPENGIQGDIERQPLPLEPPPLPEAVPEPDLQIPGEDEIQPESVQNEATITVEQFEIIDNTIFPDATLLDLPLTPLNPDDSSSCLPELDPLVPTMGTVENQTFTLSQLFQVSVVVAQFYACEGYSTSGAKVVIPETTQQTGGGVVQLQVIEGILEDVQVISNTRRSIFTLNEGYVRSRLHLDPDAPLNVADLQESLQLLQLDPLIETISATVPDGTRVGTSRLTVQFEDAAYRPLVVTLDNGRSPSVGSFQQRFQVDTPNILGLGDSLRFAYTRTDGSDAGEVGYRIPLTAADTTLNLRYSRTSSGVVEPPFDDIDSDGKGPDIESESEVYEVTLRHPISRTVSDRTFREFAVGVTASSQETESEILGLPFPSAGADENGGTNIFTLRFFQEWTQSNAREVVAVRSQFNIGLDALDSTINESIDGVGPIPDSRFFSWRGQAQWVRFLEQDMLLILRGNVQLADNVLLPAEQLAIGGAGSVRGYRQDQLQGDNGVFGSVEVRLPIVRDRRRDHLVHLVPFLDWGHVWNARDSEDTDPNTISSLGLGLQWRWGDRLTTRLDYGIPLVNLESRERTWQENGWLFSVQFRPF
ncbi:MAG: ShlB/FhaC/HecB family hemolysin secretion/activation protein [Leptolyngbyaceae cyanobacterium]